MMQQPLPDGECQVWWSSVDLDVAPLRELLDQVECERADQLRHPAARARFILGRVTARLVVARATGIQPARVAFQASCRHCAGPHGRLGVATQAGRLHLSISHSGDRVAVAVSRGVACGVDVEQLALRGDDIPLTALSPVERQVMDGLSESRHLAAFIRYWTRKEALLKATGDGLLVSPANLTVSPPDAPPRLLSWMHRPPPQLALHLTDLAAGPGYRGSVATLGRRMQVREHRADTMIHNAAYYYQVH